MTDSASVFSFGAAVVCSLNTNDGIQEAFAASATGSNGSVTFTGGFPGSRGTPILLVMKYTGVATSSALDATAVAATAASTTVVVPLAGSFTTTAANEVIIECARGDTNTTTWTAGSIGSGTGTRRQQSLTSGANYAVACQDLTVTSIQTSITASMTADSDSSSLNLFGLVLTLKASGAAVVVRTPPTLMTELERNQ